MCGQFPGHLTPLAGYGLPGPGPFSGTPRLCLERAHRLFLSKKLACLDLSRWRSHLLIWGLGNSGPLLGPQTPLPWSPPQGYSLTP